jgi:alkanesulfonate monooxygenase SsuD/methylene tetrahydromethanopterin reductase-like flavin-dependent oxidoreductase (luciferase family)
MRRIRFCAYQYADQPLDELMRRWKQAEELGFDVLWNCDAINDPDFPRVPFFEATSILTAMAMHTSTIRVGTLVNSLIFRNPAVVAKAAMTIDHLSGGRLEFGFGGGVLEADHRNSGVAWWSGGERVARFREAIHIVDLMLRNEVTTWSGEHYRVDGAEMVPGPVQEPRPPFSIPAHGPKMLRIAAEYADSWSSWGGDDVETEEHMFEVTQERSRLFDELCKQLGRDPRSIWHSLVVYPPLTPWESVEYFRDMVGRYGEIGIDEFVLYWPRKWRDAPHEDAVFEEVAREVMPALRSGR